MRVELGVNRVFAFTREFNAATFYDGIDTNRVESFGYEMQY